MSFREGECVTIRKNTAGFLHTFSHSQSESPFFTITKSLDRSSFFGIIFGRKRKMCVCCLFVTTCRRELCKYRETHRTRNLSKQFRKLTSETETVKETRENNKVNLCVNIT